MMTVRREWLRLLLLVSALVILAVGAVGIDGLFRSGYLAGEAVFLSPLYVLVLWLIGAMLLSACYRLKLATFFGLATIAILFIVLFGAWLGDLSLGHRDGMVYVTSAFALCGAVAAVRLGRSPSAAMLRERQSTVAAVIGVAIAVTSSYLILKQDISRVDQYASATAKQAAASISNAVADIVALMQRMGDRWDTLGDPLPAEFIQQEFEAYLRDFPEIGKISVLNSEGTVMHSNERGTYSEGWISEPLNEEAWRAWLHEIGQSSEARYSPFFREKLDAVWGLVAMPLRSPRLNSEFIVAQVNMTGVLERALSVTDATIAHFSVYSGDQALYIREPVRVNANTVAGGYVLDMHHGPPWTMSYQLTIPELSTGLGETNALPEFFLVFAVAFILMGSASLRFTGITKLRSKQLGAAAITDPLTGLPNRHHLEQILRMAVQDARRDATQFTVVSLGLNDVWLINETFDHTVGDAVLTEASRRLQFTLADNGTVARFGDNIFIGLLLGTDEAAAEVRVAELVNVLVGPYQVLGHTLRLTAGAGYVVSSGDVGDPMQLVRESELALLHAKQSGLNSWRRHSPDMNTLASERFAILNTLQKSLESEQLELHYQPVVSGTDGRVVAVEALLRWNHEELGYIPPVQFLPFAEETGLIVPLTDWVLREACRVSKLLRERGFPEFPVVVNISPRYFRRDDFVQRITTALHAASLSSQFLAVEITEGVLLENEEEAILKLHELNKMQIRTAIDDFGTGYSSLSYLKTLPVDKVKIDRAFVTDLVSDAAGAAITRGIISMAHHLGLKVVAEGVETSAQYMFLHRSRCDEFQGYLFAKPEPFETLLEALVKGQCRLPLPRYETESGQQVLLLVDDERNVLNALTRLFRRDGYRILVAEGAQQAFEALANHEVQVIIADQRMPGTSGIDFFSQVKGLYPSTTRIVLSGYTDLKTVQEAVNRGAVYKFLTKPWNDEELRREIAEAFRFHSQDRSHER